MIIKCLISKRHSDIFFENEVPEESESVQMDAELETSKMRLMQYIDRYNQAREREVRGNDE